MGKPQQLRKINTGDFALKTLQENVERAISEVIRSPLLDGFLLEDVALVSGSNQVSHKLGRSARGYFVVSKSNASTIYDTAKDDKFVTLVTSGAVTVSLWVF